MQLSAFATSALSALAGGALIGAAASLLLGLNGRIAGISGILAGLLAPWSRERSYEIRWRLWFVLGLLAGGLFFVVTQPGSLGGQIPTGWGITMVAGLLVGIGTRMSGGCTSGHGVCGMSRLSPRSLVATLTFMATGIATVFVVRHVLGISASPS